MLRSKRADDAERKRDIEFAREEAKRLGCKLSGKHDPTILRDLRCLPR